MIGPEIYASLRQNACFVSAELAAEITRIGPIVIEPPCHRTVADHLYVAIINQQLSGKAADAIWTRVKALCKAKGMRPSALFVPEYEADIRGCGVSGPKVRALLAVRQAQAAGCLKRKDLAKGPHEARVEMLCSIWGVGRWTADMVGIFHFQDHDIWPDSDVSAAGTLRRLTGCDSTAVIAERFAPYRSFLARYMWRSKDGY